MEDNITAFNLKDFLTDTVAKWFKSIKVFGAFRFKCFYWAYRITGWHIRHREWDFVLDYLPKLGDWQEVSVLDVGCSRNLFCHEVKRRGYQVYGIDLEDYQDEFPGTFIKGDIRKIYQCERDFVTCISVLEHIETEKDKALNNMIKSLKIGGRLLITIPTEQYAQGHEWEGFTWKSFMKLLPTNCWIVSCTERMGQLCFAIEKVK